MQSNVITVNARPHNAELCLASKLKNNMDDTVTKACQRDTINALRHLIVEHHSHDVMKDEHALCPVCTKHGWDTVLNTAAKLGQAGDAQPATVEPEETQGVGISDLLGLVTELLNMLETVEESESGKEFHPTTIQTCRCMHAAKLDEIMPKITAIVRQNPKNKISEVAGRKEI